MHILLTNDDGIFAPGLRELTKAVISAGHRATIFAPDDQRSAASHAISIARPLHVKRVFPEGLDGVPAWSVDGTPSDCARLGLFLLRNDPPDCVLSGINRGANRGAAILYSGTVAAAMEAALCGVPAAAVSRCGHGEGDYEYAAKLGAKLAEWTVAHPLPIGEIYSLNVPHLGKPLGVRWASVSHEYIFAPLYEKSGDGWQMSDGAPLVPETDPYSDLLLTRAGCATLSILGWNLQANEPTPAIDELNDVL